LYKVDYFVGISVEGHQCPKLPWGGRLLGYGGIMANVVEPDEPPDDPPQAVRHSGPKRGAFPTPQSEIDNARQYIPGMGEEDECPEGIPDQPAGDEGQNES
jgi:hypothetical protein